MSAQPNLSERWTRAALAELEAIAPIRVKRIAGELRVFPDLASCYPSRIVTRNEARARGWPCYFEGAVCSRDHLAPRFVANCGCVDCRREKAGRALVGIKLAPAEEGANTAGACAQSVDRGSLHVRNLSHHHQSVPAVSAPREPAGLRRDRQRVAARRPDRHRRRSKRDRL